MRALSLEYHDVVAGEDFDASGFPGAGPASYKLAIADFERHLAAMAPLLAAQPSRVPDWLEGRVPGRPLFITFDDGGVGALSPTADALERFGWRGHFFVTAGRIGEPTFLSAAQMRDLDARGHVIGSHSFSHPKMMGACPREQLVDEWQRSVAVIADVLGAPVRSASVPGGFYARPVAETAAAAGIRALFTSAPTTRCHTVDGCVVIGRYTLRRWSPPELAAGIAAGRWRPRFGQWAFYSALDLARTVGGDAYTRLRQRYWARRSMAPKA